ncbi:L,D-transpeptidase [Paenibacillus turpanensis]|uniref:L,D-transpeptidase n=1 Tax=Paenibacillus turpanensis TaxID=2689078 RepID=UPI001408F2B5|nr:L,D-transpeptidase [Paenibacillus turpanensis]
MEEHKQREGRFQNHLMKDVIPLKHNLYLHPADPRYYEKKLEYYDRNCPEAHYHLGLKKLREGNREAGVLHLTQCLRTPTSPYYSKARSVLAKVDKEIRVSLDSSKLDSSGAPTHFKKSKQSPSRSAARVTLVAAILCLCFAFLLFISAPILRSAEIASPFSSVGMDVVYESEELPFVIYLPYQLSTAEIERLLYDHAVTLAAEHPQRKVLLYGVYSSAKAAGTPVPLREIELKDQAFVTAAYKSETDASVKIRFHQSAGNSSGEAGRIEETQFAANVVRTALLQYKEDHGKLPDDVRELFGVYPDNYLSVLPLEPLSESHKVLAEIDYTGGWAYNSTEIDPEQMFRPNSPMNIAFEPVEIVVNRQTHQLVLRSGSIVALREQVGLGKESSTPVGLFAVDQRVLDPQGRKSGVYGTAGLSFGQWAVHGTNDEHSIGKNESLGCVRMKNEAISKLFPMVPKGAAIRIEESGLQDAIESNSYLSQVHRLFPSIEAEEERAPKNTLFSWLG